MHDDTASLESCFVTFCLERITESEDFAAAEERAHEDALELLSRSFAQALEIFDRRLFADKPEGWRVKDIRPRLVLTEFGEVCFRRRVYVDEYGDRRTRLDEVLSLPARRRLSPCAFQSLSRFAADIPYERAANMLFRRCGAGVTRMTVMGTLRQTGELLEREAEDRRESLFEKGLLPDAEKKTAEILVESDGIWVPLQREKRRNAEIKALCAYAGKEGGRRNGTLHHAMIGGERRFWEEGVASIGSRYCLASIRRCYSGTDGAGWCKRLPDYLHGPVIVHKLDPWHVNEAIRTAFSDKEDASPLFGLAAAGDIEALLDVLASRLETGCGEEKKVKALIRYLSNNRSSIEASAPSMGTMEGSNAHVCAARMKVWGGAWSIRGASDMARIRSTLASGRDLPVPVREHAFPLPDRRRREKVKEKRERGGGFQMVLSSGKGYEPRAGHLMPFSTKQAFRAMFNPFN